MRTLTHRQYLTWHAWLRTQWNKPDRTDHYLMMIIAVIKTYMTQKVVDPATCKMPFEFKCVTPRKINGNGRKKIEGDIAELRTMAALGVKWDLVT